MAKKNFSGGLNTLLGETATETEQKEPVVQETLADELKRLAQAKVNKVGRPRTNFKDVNKSSQEGTLEGETRATFILGENLLDKVKAVAYWDRLKIKEVVNTALEEYLSRYEKKNGTIKPMPKK
jgi:hypothetical protein